MTPPISPAKDSPLKLTIGVSEASQTRTVRRLEYEGAELRDLLDDALDGLHHRERVAWLHIDRAGGQRHRDSAEDRRLDDELERELERFERGRASEGTDAVVTSLDERRLRRSQGEIS